MRCGEYRYKTCTSTYNMLSSTTSNFYCIFEINRKYIIFKLVLNCILLYRRRLTLKGSLTLDFWLQVFFVNRFPAGPWVSNWGHFDFLLKFAEIFAALRQQQTQQHLKKNVKNLPISNFFFLHLSPLSLKTVINIYFRLSSRIFVKNSKRSPWWARGKLIHEKTWSPKSRIRLPLSVSCVAWRQYTARAHLYHKWEFNTYCKTPPVSKRYTQWNPFFHFRRIQLTCVLSLTIKYSLWQHLF